MAKFRIQLRRVKHDYLLIDVEAESLPAARRKAKEHAAENSDDFCDESIEGAPRIVFVERVKEGEDR